MADLVGPIQIKRGTSDQWAASTVPLRNGEIGVDLTSRRMKIGDGGTLWASLRWISPDAATLRRLEDLAEAVDGSSAPTDASMTAVQANEGSTFTKAQAVKIAAAVAEAMPPEARLTVSSALASTGGGIKRVYWYGMSIAAANAAEIQEMLLNQFGDASACTVRGGFLGGTNDQPHRGWHKQPYGGRGFIRARASSSSSYQIFPFYGDTLHLDFSREADSAAADIWVDGVVVGQTPGPGSQKYGIRQTYTGFSRGFHEVKLRPPSGSGYVYFEYAEAYDSTRTGVIFANFTLGGTLMANMVEIPTPTGAQVAGIPVEGDNGIDGHFDWPEVNAFGVHWDVNDAGADPSKITAQYAPTLAKIVSKTRAAVQSLTLISSMGGHYAMPKDQGGSSVNDTTGWRHANFEKTRSLMSAAQGSNSHVVHLDWHAATVLSDFAKYANLYYSATNVNPTAGTFSGDFIHPKDAASRVLYDLVASRFGIGRADSVMPRTIASQRMARAPRFAPAYAIGRAARLIASSYIVDTDADTLITPVDHRLSVGDQLIFDGDVGAQEFPPYPGYVHSVINSTTFRVTATPGGSAITFGASTGQKNGARLYAVRSKRYAGSSETGWLVQGTNTYSVNPWGAPGVEVPVFADPEAFPIERPANSVRTTIDASSLSDRWGKYLAPTGQNFADSGAFFRNVQGMLLIRFSGIISLRFGAAQFIELTDLSYNTLPYGDSGTGDAAASSQSLFLNGPEPGDKPITVALPIKKLVGGAYVFVGGNGLRLYDWAMILGTTAVWPGGM